MRLKEIILLFCLCSISFSFNSAYAFPNCQLKYDSDKRSLSALRGMCNVCHLSTNGGGPTNEFGKAFAAAGFKITDDLVAKFPNLFQKQISDNNSSSGITPSQETQNPTIKRLKPTKVKTNVQTMISIMGQNFVSGAKAFIDNNEAITTFKSNVLLIADFIFNSAGKHEVKVQNPDGKESNTAKIKSK